VEKKIFLTRGKSRRKTKVSIVTTKNQTRRGRSLVTKKKIFGSLLKDEKLKTNKKMRKERRILKEN